MKIFNSLGSNYNLAFALEALKSANQAIFSVRLKSFLADKYQGEIVLVYKGREALELVLKLIKLPPNSLIAVNGFTCYTVYKAIVNAGHKSEYLDIGEKDLNFSPETLKAQLKKKANIRVVIVQNTLGYPCDIEKIAKICQDHQIVLIEDLAHSVGTVYKNGQEAGKVGDFVVLSFSQDKIIDGVSGGALIIRNKKYQNKSISGFEKVTTKQQVIDHLYPFLTYLIRATYQIGLGKLVHSGLKKVGLLSKPMGNQKVNNNNVHFLPNWYANLAYKCFLDLQKNLSHRRELAQTYADKINPQVLSATIVEKIPYATNVRFPVFVADRFDLIKHLSDYGVHVSDVWYDAPIAPKKYLSLTDYKTQCPASEKMSNQILNLPTHKNITVKQAEKIAERINQWLKLP